MISITYEAAYFSEAYFQSPNGSSEFEFQSEFTIEFPVSSGVASSSPSFTYQNASLTPLYGDGSISRVYTFTDTGKVYSYGLFGSVKRKVYKVVISEYNGEECNVVNGDCAYVYIQSDWWEDFTSVGYVPYNIIYLNQSQLPDGLEYISSGLHVSSDNPITFLYDFGNSVYRFFPSLGSVMSINIDGNDFVYLLTSGFLVYCGIVIVKFILPI